MPTIIEKTNNIKTNTCTTGFEYLENPNLAIPYMYGMRLKYAQVPSLSDGDADYSDQLLPPSIYSVDEAHATNALILPSPVGLMSIIINRDADTALLVKSPGGVAISIPASSIQIVIQDTSFVLTPLLS